MSNLKKLLAVLLVGVITLSSVSALTINTSVSGASGIYEDMTKGLLPTNAQLHYYVPLTLIKGRTTSLYLNLDCGYGRSSISSDPLTGKYKGLGSYDFIYSGWDFGFKQGFLKSNNGSDLFQFELCYTGQFRQAIEPIAFHRGESGPTFHEPGGTGFKEIWNGNHDFVAYPELMGDRWSVYNRLEAYMYTRFKTFWFNHTLTLGAMYAPDWFWNNGTDFYRLTASLSSSREFLRTDWSKARLSSFTLSHYMGYTFFKGTKIPTYICGANSSDQRFSESMTVTWNGPVVLGDCYPYISMSLNNSFNWGNILNTKVPTTYYDGKLYYSCSMSFTFHLRMFNIFHANFGASYGIYNTSSKWNSGFGNGEWSKKFSVYVSL